MGLRLIETEEEAPKFVPDPAIQEAVNTVWQRLMDTQPLLETILTMPIDQIGKFKQRLYADLLEWKEENL